MTDKVQKIRDEVERLKSQLLRGACASQIAMETRCKEEAYNEMIAIIDSMQEEPVNEDKMTISKEWFEHCKKSWYNEGYIDGEYNRDRQFEEPVSNDLEEAASMYAKEEYNHKCPATLPDRCKGCYAPLMYAFKAGAEWQRKQIIQ